MEYNKDEALRAKEIAESKFMAHDLAGAKKFALKAQQLYSSLEGLPQLLAVLEVHLAAENKVNGLMDWYGILQVDCLAEEAIIKKQYRKLALLLHPDKNKSVGAEGAFKYIGEAWGVLSDTARRAAHDSKRNNYGPFHQTQRVQKPQRPAPPAPPATGSNGFYHFSPQPRAASSAAMATFWTSCPFCKMQYEYPRNYVNRNLLCPSCQRPFLAFEGPSVPRNGAYQPKFPAQAFSQMPSGIFAGAPSGGVSQNPNYYSQNVFSGAPNPTGAAREPREKPKNGSAKKGEAEKRSRSKKEKSASSAAKGPAEKVKKKRKVEIISDSDDERDADDDVEEDGEDVVEITKTKQGAKKRPPKADLEEDALRKKGRKAEKKGAMESPSGKKGRSVDGADSREDPSPKSVEPEAISVPDSDFHDFDSERTRDALKLEQIWAVYDDHGGMPRFYARLMKDMCTDKKFLLKMNWLEPEANKNKALKDWLAAGFYQGCGDFKIADVFDNVSLNTLSHLVTWEKGPNGVIRILPRKGEVWALYRHWSSTWNKSTPPEERSKFEMVEILDDFVETVGVNVAPLVKVDGFRTVFQRRLEARVVPRDELLRFSHQVPAKRLSGDESPNLPQHCWELDPAATPADLSDSKDEGNGCAAVDQACCPSILSPRVSLT